MDVRRQQRKTNADKTVRWFFARLADGLVRKPERDERGVVHAAVAPLAACKGNARSLRRLRQRIDELAVSPDINLCLGSAERCHAA